MAARTKISWTDYTWNVVTGCTKVSQGCKNCYAETIANRFWKDRKFTDVKYHPERLGQLYRLRKPRMIFVNSMSDLFHDKVPAGVIIDIFDAIANNDQHTYQILTKRPQRMQELISEYMGWVMGQKNIWLGVSVEDQKTVDERIPSLLQTPAAVRWISVEPLLEHIELRDGYKSIGAICSSCTGEGHYHDNFNTPCPECKQTGKHTPIDWVVVGCESGPKKRECKIEWVEDIVNQCKRAKIPVFVKQIQINGKVERDIDNFPKGLQVREYPI